MLKNVLFIVGIVLIVSACGKQDKVKPEDAAINFFSAIYNEKNIDKARSFASDDLKKELAKYKSAKHFARQYLFLSFDKVTINSALGDKVMRSEFYSSGTLTVLFDGFYNDKRVKEIRKVHLVNVADKWYIDKIYDDKMYSNDR